MEIAQWIANVLAFFLLVATIYFLRKSINQVEHQLQLAREERAVYQRDSFYGVWSKLDELVIQYPRLSELWLEPETLARIKDKCPSDQAAEDYYRRRAFAAIIMGIYFRDYKLDKEIQETVGGGEFREVTLDNQELWKMWYEGDLRNDYALFPEFVDFVEKYFFKNAPKDSSK